MNEQPILRGKRQGSGEDKHESDSSKKRSLSPSGEWNGQHDISTLVQIAIEKAPPGLPNSGSDLSNLLNRPPEEASYSMDNLDSAVVLAEKALAASGLSEVIRIALETRLSNLLSTRFDHTGNIADLDYAIFLCRVTLTKCQDNEMDYLRGGIENNLGGLLNKRFEHSGIMDDLDEAIVLAERAVMALESMQADGSTRAAGLSNLSSYLLSRYVNAGSLEDLQVAVGKAELALATAPSTERAVYLNTMSNCLRVRFDYTGELADLDRAVSSAQEALQVASPADIPLYLTTLSNSLSIRFKTTGDRQDLDEAISAAEQAVGSAPQSHIALSLDTLSNARALRFKHTGNVNDLRESVALSERAVEATTINGASRASRVHNLSDGLSSRYIRFGDGKDLQQSLSMTRSTVDTTPKHDTNRFVMLDHLSTLMALRFESHGDVADLEYCITTARQALAAAPLGDRRRADVLHNISNHLSSLFERTGDLVHIGEAFAAAKEAVSSVGEDDPNKAAYQDTLGGCFISRFNWTGNLEDLHESVSLIQKAVDATPTDHPARAPLLNNLSNVLTTRARHTGNTDDLQTAIAWIQEAVNITPEDDHYRAVQLDTLSMCLGLRFEFTTDMKDLDNALVTAQQAVSATPEDDPNMPMHLSHLTSLLMSRFDRAHNVEDLEEAIVMAERALSATQLEDPTRAGRLNNLSGALSVRFQRTNSLEDIDRSIALAELAVKATPADRPVRASMLCNLTNHLTARFEQTGVMQDLHEAICRVQKALGATPDNHPGRADYLRLLGNCLDLRFERTANLEDQRLAVQCFRSSLMQGCARPLTRIYSGKNAADTLIKMCNWREASDVLGQCVRLLPKVSQRSLQRLSQEYIAGQMAGLASTAGSTVLQAGKSAWHALELLELGRGVYAGLVMSLRGELSELEKLHPALAEQYKESRDQLNVVISDEEQQHGLIIQRRWSTLADLENAEHEIRQLPGFENFELPLTAEDVVQLAARGPIVVFNASTTRSDAIIVTEAGIDAVALSSLNYQELEMNLAKIWSGDRPLVKGPIQSFGKRNLEMARILEWLWDVAVEVVLEHLGFLDGRQRLPHVWWIGCGPMSRLPFHAAGYHSRGSVRNTISKVISSYVPTVKTLAYMRKRQLGRLRLQGEDIIVVAVSETPGYVDLEVDDEIEAIQSHFPLVSVLSNPPKAAVIKALKGCKVAHFACHGEFVPDKPSDSSLLLKGAGSGSVDRLTVREITAINHEVGSIAYLSACSTATNSPQALMDEVFNVASSFQLAGFPHVIGSFWRAMDDTSVDLAGEFYKEIRKHGDRAELEHEMVATAFHIACTAIRAAEGPGRVLTWAPYVHVGA